MKYFHSTYTHNQHKERNNMKIIKDAGMEQQRNIEHANRYIDETTTDVIGQINTTAMIAKREGEAPPPEAKTIEAIGNVVIPMVNQIKAINSDTTKTQDAVTLLQANKIDAGIAKAKAILSEGVGKLNTLTHAAEDKLFSRRVNEQPQGLAMLANDTLLKEIRANYLDFVDSPYSAAAVNSFRVYGLLPKELNDSIAGALNRRHSPEAVATIENLNKAKENLQYMEKSLTRTHQLLNSNAEKIASIRARVFE